VTHGRLYFAIALGAALLYLSWVFASRYSSTLRIHSVKSRLDSGFDQATSFFRNLLLAAAVTREVISFVRTI